MFARPVRSPTVRANERGGRQKVIRQFPSEKWPTPLLEHMVKRIPSFAGRNVKDLVAILDDVQNLSPAKAKEQAKRICSEHSIKAYDLYVLGEHLRRYNDLKYRDLSNALEACALAANDGQLLAFRIIRDAMSTGRIREPQMSNPLKIVKDYVDQGYPKAIFIWGRLMESQGKHSEALQFYQKWTEIYAEARQSPPFSQSMDTAELANISKALARLRARSGDRAAAETAIREAAQVYDDPTAYYHLAVEFTSPSSPEFETYLLKAAASGNPNAAHELGMLYFNQSRQGIRLITPTLTHTSFYSKNPNPNPNVSAPPPPLPQVYVRKKQAAAKEWFAVAASSNITASQIYLALLLLLHHNSAEADEALEWLHTASSSNSKDKDNDNNNNSGGSGEKWTEAIEYLKRISRFNHDNNAAPPPDLTHIDIEALRRRSRAKTPKSLLKGNDKDKDKDSNARLANLLGATLGAEPRRSREWSGMG
ncbi:MAG: hypothetical protein Q9216_004971 [Gyalolechia sp. 2 TL-2023]